MRKTKVESMIKELEENYNLTETEQEKLIIRPWQKKKGGNGGNNKKKVNRDRLNEEKADFDQLNKGGMSGKNKDIIYFLIKEKSNLNVDLARISYSRIIENIYEVYEDIKRVTRLSD